MRQASLLEVGGHEADHEEAEYDEMASGRWQWELYQAWGVAAPRASVRQLGRCGLGSASPPPAARPRPDEAKTAAHGRPGHGQAPTGRGPAQSDERGDRTPRPLGRSSVTFHPRRAGDVQWTRTGHELVEERALISDLSRSAVHDPRGCQLGWHSWRAASPIATPGRAGRGPHRHPSREVSQ
jgi:hypothetical protein